MASILNADIAGGLKATGDTSGVLQIQAGSVTVANIASSGVNAGIQVAPYAAPTFMYNNAAGGQTFTGATDTKAQFITKNWDTANAFNATGSTVTLNGLSVPAYSFCPPVAGYYQFNGMIQLSTAAYTNCIDFFKNGSFDSNNGFRGVLGNNQGPSASAIIYLNGTGDYVD